MQFGFDNSDMLFQQNMVLHTYIDFLLTLAIQNPEQLKKLATQYFEQQKNHDPQEALMRSQMQAIIEYDPRDMLNYKQND